MDSGNSGSMNSSSGGDDHDYDSRATAESISALFNPSPPPHTQIQNPNSSFNFDPQPNFFNNPFANLNSPSGWSDPNRAVFDPPLPVSLPAPAPPNDHQTVPAQAVRNPKKRSRASRRAPTTVLTTDTTNFRAMVQEFTGIPASPFMSSSGPFARSKLDDFFRAPSSIRSNLSLQPQQPQQQQLPNYLLKPFPQKLQQPPPFLSSTSFQSLPLQSSKSLENQPSETLGKTGLLSEFGFSQPEITGGVANNISCSSGGGGGGNYGGSSSSSQFLGSSSENVGARGGEGMMESWICSSD